MNLKKMWKRFWTLDVHNHEGFTLVELIIVIAILAILSSVAVVGYSSYVEKANKQADRTLITEIENALLLAYYNDPNAFKGGVVILSPNAYAKTEGLNDIMAEAFGTNWNASDALKLKYNGWSATFQGSSFCDDGLGELVGTVDTLTGALAGALGAIEGLTGSGFSEYVAGLGAGDDSQAQANAAVFYVADITGDLGADDMSDACMAMIEGLMYTQGNDVEKATAAMAGMNDVTGSSLASAAMMYAMATGYAKYYNEQHPDKVNDPNNPANILAEATEGLDNADISKDLDAFVKLTEAFNKMLAVDPVTAEAYANNAMEQDALAYADAMKTVSASKDSILKNNGELGATGYFGDSEYISLLLNSYTEGAIFIYVKVGEDGALKFTTTIDEE